VVFAAPWLTIECQAVVVDADPDPVEGAPDESRPGMRRVSVTGAMGSGKTTFGRRLARVLGVPFLDLDSIFHQPGGTELPQDEFQARVSKVISGDGWVVDGNYGAVRDLVSAAADTVVFLDPSRAGRCVE
jgi:adenylate kinase family enzyme